MRFICLYGYMAFALAALAPSAFGQQAQCFQLAQNGIRYGAWEAIKAYFLSLSPSHATKTERDRLLILRNQIIDLEIRKRRLIDLVSAHLNGETSGTIVSSQLSLNDIPTILRQIDDVSRNLADISQTGSLFAAGKAFKELKVNFDEKRAYTLCKLAEQTASTDLDRSAVSKLIDNLRRELNAISDAEDALGEYITKTSE